MAPPRNSGSKPGRALAALLVLIVVMLAGIVGSNIGSPGHWHKDFKVGLGLDLSSGTQATLRAVTQKGQDPPSADMKEAVAIINDRVNASGNTGVSVQQQGATDIQVTAPGQGSQQLINNVDTTAQLRFRAVLLEGSSAATATPAPSSTAGPGATSGATPSASTKAIIKPAAATPSPSAQASSLSLAFRPSPSKVGPASFLVSPSACSAATRQSRPWCSRNGSPRVSATMICSLWTGTRSWTCDGWLTRTATAPTV